jgi:hypothetical protein
MVLGIKFSDTRRKEEKRRKYIRKREREKKQKNFKIYTAPGRLESFTVKSRKQRNNSRQR